MSCSRALLIVDLQNDFCPKGALGVPEGDTIVPVINKYIEEFSKLSLPIFATRDWHPEETKHFKEFGGKWPAHCIKNTPGSRFHPDLKLPKDVVLLYKGMDPAQDDYSSFSARNDKGTTLGALLRELKIEELYIAGLATDYCVKYTGLDALGAGLKVKILVDAVKGVNLKTDDSREALMLLAESGAQLVDFKKTQEELCNLTT